MIEFTQVLTAFIGSLGFAMLFNIRGRKLWLAAAGGMMSWLVYLLVGFLLGNEMTQYFMAAIAVTAYSEGCARIEKTPATTFLTASLIPLVPGRALYYTMSYAVSGRFEEFAAKGAETASLAASIAAGVMVASSILRIFASFKQKLGEGQE